MKNIIIRDKNNQKIDSKLKKEFKTVVFEGKFKFNKIKKTSKLANSTFYNFKYFFDFEEENDEFLLELENAIREFDLKQILNLCDSLNFRFFKAYEYIHSKISIEEENYEKYYSLFVELFKKAKTVNSVNLAVYIIYFINKNVAKNICKNIFKNDLNYIEITSFVLRNTKYETDDIILNMFINFYVRKNTFIFLNTLNISAKSTYKEFIMSFYLYDISKIPLYDLSDFELETFFTFVFNLKKSTNSLTNAYLMDDMFGELKPLIKNVNDLFEYIEKIVDFKSFNYLNLDYKIFMFYIEFFKGFEDYIDNKVLNGIFTDFISYIETKDYINGKKVILIFNKLDVDVTESLFNEIKHRSDFIDLCKSILRICSKYKYFSSIITSMEKYFYITALIKDDDFRTTLIRNLYIYYNGLNFEVVGNVFLKAIMEYENLYHENKNYINLILEEILERMDN